MNKIAVIGSGTMGNGIAHVFAQHGFKVSIIDISEDALKKAISTIDKNLSRQLEKGTITADEKQLTLSNLSTTTFMKEGLQDVELVTILASNTSSISITKIASVTKSPGNVIGMHFMNPVPIMKLVEIIRGYSTSNETTEVIMELSKKLGKIPVEVNDYPGFVANRILMPMINEAIYSLYEGVAGVEEIDNVMKLGMAHPKVCTLSTAC